MHHEVDKGKELFQLSKLISLLAGLVDVEPSLSDLSETGLDDFLEAANPTLLASVEADLSDGAGLDLFEFFNSESLSFD